MDPKTQHAETVIARMADHAAKLSEDRDRLREINAELLAALKQARLALLPNVEGGNIDRVAVQDLVDAAIAKASQ